ncbi:MAG: hypothetical protein A2Y63_01490 [Candidatus Riflebacteria bacterium RBG_13_59_9]|nr:MAG: hypothetical protein A2Y63_01490 [Candidatus Riflebacteria bacterium RBG_13_59_9]
MDVPSGTVSIVDRAVVVVAILIGLMAMVDTLALSIRTSGAISKRLATALALFGLVIVFARLSNLIQAPIVGNMADKTDVSVPALRDLLLEALRWKIHIIILATSIGTIVGGLLTPTFVRIFRRVMEIFEQVKTLPRVMLYLLYPRRWLQLPRYIVWPHPERISGYLRGFGRLPLDFIFFQVLVTAFYTVGVLATIYAAALHPQLRATSVTLSGIVNGIATLLLFILVDPPAAMITDQCINGVRPIEDVKIMNTYLVAARFIGTILAQFILVVMAHWVMLAAGFVDALFP